MSTFSWTEEDILRCCGSKRFAKEMAAASPFADPQHAVRCARDIWFNKVDVAGWLEAFATHPAIGSTSPSVSQWCKEEQSAAIATATDSSFQELADWNIRYKEKFGHVFLICASGRRTPEILAELKAYEIAIDKIGYMYAIYFFALDRFILALASVLTWLVDPLFM